MEFEQNVRRMVNYTVRISSQETKRRGVFTLHLKFNLIGMQKIVRQACGIDVAQDELVVALGRLYDDLTPDLYAHKTFPNTDKGFEALLGWVKRQTVSFVPTRYVMEATGVYHERLAYYLHGKEEEVSVVLPNKISNYFRTLGTKTITDKTASEAITYFGLERKLDNWQPANPVYRKLRQLVRERDQVVQLRTIVKNQLHAEEAEACPGKTTLARMKKQIQLLNKQEQEIKIELAAIVKQHDGIKKQVELITSIPGVGSLTAVTVLAETNGFELIRNKRQLTSYAGLDVREKQSGTSVKGKPRISKKGNRFLRKAMHLPALSAIRHDERFKAVFTRLVSKHGIKMKAAVAVQRKLLELIYTIFKTGNPYCKEYLEKTREQQIATP